MRLIVFYPTLGDSDGHLLYFVCHHREFQSDSGVKSPIAGFLTLAVAGPFPCLLPLRP